MMIKYDMINIMIHAMLCFALLCFAVPCWPCRAVPCHDMLYHAEMLKYSKIPFHNYSI